MLDLVPLRISFDFDAERMTAEAEIIASGKFDIGHGGREARFRFFGAEMVVVITSIDTCYRATPATPYVAGGGHGMSTRAPRYPDCTEVESRIRIRLLRVGDVSLGPMAALGSPPFPPELMPPRRALPRGRKR